jgi:hypothetical protein
MPLNMLDVIRTSAVLKKAKELTLVLIDGDTKGHSCGKKYGNRFEKWIGYDSKKYLS